MCGSSVRCVAMNKKGNLLACGLWNGEVQIWDYLQCVKLTTLIGHTDMVLGICFSNDSENVFSASKDK